MSLLTCAASGFVAGFVGGTAAALLFAAYSVRVHRMGRDDG